MMSLSTMPEVAHTHDLLRVMPPVLALPSLAAAQRQRVIQAAAPLSSDQSWTSTQRAIMHADSSASHHATPLTLPHYSPLAAARPSSLLSPQ